MAASITTTPPSPLSYNVLGLHKGQSIKYVTLILTNFDPPSSGPLSHFSVSPLKYVTHLGPPPILVIQRSRTKTPCRPTKYLSMVRGVFVRGFCSGFFVEKDLSEVVFVHSPSVRIPPLQQKASITFNFTFHMYDKICLKCDVT